MGCQVTVRAIAGAFLMLVGCGGSAPLALGEDAPATPCEEVIDGCSARRLDNVVLRGDARDGALRSIDGMDASEVIGFDEALSAAGANDLTEDEAETVQVVLGAADAEELRWGEGGTRLFYAVQWGGVEMFVSGPPGLDHPPEFGTWSTVLDAVTGRYVVSGSG
jgi:hypothetical protein